MRLSHSSFTISSLSEDGKFRREVRSRPVLSEGFSVASLMGGFSGGALRSMSDRLGDGRRHTGIECAGDHIAGLQVLTDEISDGPRGRELHVIGDLMRIGVQRTTEDPGERE